MKNRIFAIIALMSLLTVYSCSDKDSDENTMDLEVNFKIEYNGEPLVMFEEYEYPTGEPLTFNRFSFYLSNLAMNKTSGQSNLLDVQYLNFTNQNVDLAGAEEGITLNFPDTDIKDLENIFLMIGVDPTNNAKKPADFPSSNDLSKSGEYWGGWNSYVFTKTEGFITVDGEEVGYSLHTGSDDARVDFLLDGSEIGQDGKNRVEIVIDLWNYFGGVENTYDIKSNPQLHSLDQKPQVLELTDNLRTNSVKFRVTKG